MAKRDFPCFKIGLILENPHAVLNNRLESDLELRTMSTKPLRTTAVNAVFYTTQWSVVLRAANNGSI